MTAGNRYLVIARVNDQSLHRQWLAQPAYKNFDLMLDYYGDQQGLFQHDADFYCASKGFKWPKIADLLEQYHSVVERYEAVWFPDCDISADTWTIHRLFEWFSRQDLLLAQPALSHDSYFSYAITRQDWRYQLRYTNFVEIMVPMFSHQALECCRPTFRSNRSGWGLDLVWPKLLGNPRNRIAVIDDVPVRHTQPLYRSGWYRTLTHSPYQELVLLAQSYDISLPYPFRVLGGIPTGNHKQRSVAKQQLIWQA